MITLIKVVQRGDNYTFEDWMVDPEKIEEISSATNYNRMLTENADKFPSGLHVGTQFSKVQTSSGTHVVVGTMSEIHNKRNNGRRLLKG